MQSFRGKEKSWYLWAIESSAVWWTIEYDRVRNEAEAEKEKHISHVKEFIFPPKSYGGF